MMKLWQKNIPVDKEIETFTVGKDREMDLYLAQADVLGSMAHITMLESIGLLTASELQDLLHELKNIYQLAASGQFRIEEGVEDVHSQVELMLTRKLGEVGKKIHSGRSRNDQVLLDIKLFTRSAIRTIVENLSELIDLLIAQSNKYKDVLLPGYTHLQVAMPSSFGLWFGAYAESLVDDLQLLQAAYRICNRNPLGSAAGYGSSFPLNRRMTTDLLGFDSMNYNVVYAQMGRGKLEKTVAFALAGIAATLSKLASDACLYSSQNFGFINLPCEFTTGSSIMPHKKNPDVFELTRAKCNLIQSIPQQITLITNNLPSGYFRDFQVTKEIFLPSFNQLSECIDMTALMMKSIKVNETILDDDKYSLIFSVEKVNELVLKGVPFRDAYRQVGTDIEAGNFLPEKKINHTHEGSIGNLCNDRIKDMKEKIIKEFNFEKVNRAVQKLVSFTILLFIFSFQACDDELYSPIPNMPVSLTIDLSLRDVDLIPSLATKTFATKRDEIDRTGFGGLLIINGYSANGETNLYAYDLACPVEANRNTKVIPDNTGKAKCPKCEASYSIAYGTGMPESKSKYPLKSYAVRRVGEKKYTILN
jgi:argininosuccinate lyase